MAENAEEPNEPPSFLKGLREDLGEAAKDLRIRELEREREVKDAKTTDRLAKKDARIAELETLLEQRETDLTELQAKKRWLPASLRRNPPLESEV